MKRKLSFSTASRAIVATILAVATTFLVALVVVGAVTGAEPPPAPLGHLAGCFEVSYRFVEDGVHDKDIRGDPYGSFTQTVIGPFEDFRHACTAPFAFNQWRCATRGAPKPQRDRDRQDYQTLDRETTLQITPRGWSSRRTTSSATRRGARCRTRSGGTSIGAWPPIAASAGDDNPEESKGSAFGLLQQGRRNVLAPMRTRGAPEAEASASVQDYLAAIDDLESGGERVIGMRLARYLGVSPPAVAEAVQRLRRARYVRVGRGKRLTLTARGRRIAEVMARRRRLLERWLTGTLGLDRTEAYEEAHRLEHALSPRVEQRLAKTLGVTSTGSACQPREAENRGGSQMPAQPARA